MHPFDVRTDDVPGRGWWRAAGAYLAAVLLPIALILLVHRLRLPAFVFEHLVVLLVVACAIPWGLGPALVTAVVAVGADNLLLREPIGQPAITGARDAIDLLLFVIVAVTIAWLVATARRQRVRAEQAAERERRAREDRDRLIATISHDLATPLNAIRGSVQLAQRFGSDNGVDRGLLGRLETAASRASSLVETLRDTQALERGELSLHLTHVDLRDVVTPVVEMFDRISERHPIVMYAADAPLPIQADAARLQRVIENLLANAIKYSPSGGMVEVSAGRDGSDAVVSVRDHGIGISDEALPHIFDPSFRAPEAAAAAPGLGLGLSIAMEISRRHGGTLQARRAMPEGTIFVLRLPLISEAARAGAPAAAHVVPDR